MKTLLIYKKSTYEFYVVDNNNVDLSEDEVLSLKRAHQANEISIKATEDALDILGMEYRKTYRASEFNDEEFGVPDLIVSVGGDGTFIEASRFIEPNSPQIILGVNSDPKTSFGNYCVANRGNVFEALYAIKNDNAKIEHTWRIGFSIDGVDHPFPAMNDLLIAHACPAGLTRYFIQPIGFMKEEHFSSGLWVASFKGQTGAIESFNGPTICFQDQKMAFQTVGLNDKKKKEPYNLLQGSTSSLTILSKMREGKIYVDGQHIELDFPYNSKLDISVDCGIHIVEGF
jgi:NAD+ kinase